jgi:glycosyltransferase involved in cell wall biosynthesis
MASGVQKKDPFHRYLYNRIDLIFAISNYVLQSVLNTCPVPPDKVTLLHNAISLDKYDPSLYDKVEIRKELQIDLEPLVIGFVGRFTPGKGHEEFLLAAKRVKEMTPHPVKFLLVGSASYKENHYFTHIRCMADKLLSPEDIIFTGFRIDIPRMMKAMDILVFPSHEESFGNVLLEAMAMKIPIIASHSGGVPDIVIDGQTGILTPPKEFKSLANQILHLIQSPQLRVKLQENGRQRVEKYFNFDSYMDSLLLHYAGRETS